MPMAFISHSHEDRSFIEIEILPRLKSRNIKLWYSPDAIQTAEDWERAIKTGLQISDVFVVMMSPRAATSPWVQAELHWAFTERPNRVVPVMLKSCNPADCHLLLSRLQYVDLTRGDLVAAVEVMAAAIDRTCTTEVAADTDPHAMSKAERRAAEQATPLLKLALGCLTKHDYGQALRYATSALQISQHAGAYYARGLAYFGAKDWIRAIEDFSTTIARGPMPSLKPLVFTKRARARAEVNDDLRAIIDCDHAIKLDSSNAEAIHTRGVLRWRILQPEKALEDFSEFVRLKPNTVEGYAQRGQVYRELGDFERSRADFQTVRKLDPAASVPEHFLASDRLGSENLRLEEALRTLRIVGRLIKMDALPAGAQAQLFAQIERIGFPKAITDIEYVLQRVPEGRPEHELAKIVQEPLKASWRS